MFQGFGCSGVRIECFFFMKELVFFSRVQEKHSLWSPDLAVLSGSELVHVRQDEAWCAKSALWSVSLSVIFETPTSHA